MYVITSIIQGVRNESKVNVFLDGEFWISLDKNTLLNFDLFKGKQIDENLKKVLETQSFDDKILGLAYKYATARPHSEKEVLDYLVLKRELTKDKAREILQKLKEQNLVSDLTYTNWFVDKKLSSGLHGGNKIRANLLAKGVSSEVIHSVLSEKLKSEDVQTAREDKISNFIQKNLHTLKGDSNDVRNKIFQRLMYRGFEYDEIKRVWRKLNPSTSSGQVPSTSSG